MSPLIPEIPSTICMCVGGVVFKSLCITTFLQKAWKLYKIFKEKGHDSVRKSLLPTECSCPSKIYMSKSNPNVIVFGGD